MYARWLKPRSFSWLMSVTRPTRTCLFVVVVAPFELFEPPPQPAAMTTRSGRSRSRSMRDMFTTVERKPAGDATTATRPRPEQVTLAVVFQVRGGRLHVLLWERGREPQQGFWALPGGYLDAGETLEESIRRHLAQKVDVRELSHLEQLETLSDPGRDPRGWQLATAYLGLVPSDLDPELPRDAAWQPVDALPRSAFDHGSIVLAGRERLRAKLSYTNAGFALAPADFTLSELRDVYAAALGHDVSPTNLQRVLVRRRLLEPTGRRREPGRTGGRPPPLSPFPPRRLQITHQFAVLRPPTAQLQGVDRSFQTD